MENQHKKIIGYRGLNQAEIDAMNAVKAEGESIGNLLDSLEINVEGIDYRWLDIARTHLQEGIMAAVRSIAKPESF